MNAQHNPIHWNENWYASIVLLLLGGMAIATAVMMGVGDNIPAIGLLYVGLGLCGLAIVRNWNKPIQYGRLLILSIVGFPVFVVLHNLFYGLAIWLDAYTLVTGLLGVLEAGFFIIAVLICPVTAVIGFFGLLKTWLSANQ